MRVMTKRAFRMILERQQSSGLTITEFCRNESYNPASFHHWKSKFGFTHQNVATESRPNELSEDFAPVRFSAAQRQLPTVAPTPEEEAKTPDTIMIELPVGVKIHFSGSLGAKAAMGIISQMYSGHV